MIGHFCLSYIILRGLNNMLANTAMAAVAKCAKLANILFTPLKMIYERQKCPIIN